jgi:hypothetical protein
MATKKATAKKATGSQKLASSKSVTSGVLAKAVAVLDKNKLNHDILINGIPIPDVLKGSIRARNAKELNTALSALLKIEGIEYKPIRLFPKGIPVIDIIEAQIEGRLRNR